jgi:hypothetical protein
MTRAFSLVAAMLLLGSPVSAFSNGDKPKQKSSKHQQSAAADHTNHTNVAAHVVFSDDDRRMIHEYYGQKYRALPPGLQKKYARTGTLPPGWQKKMEPFPPALERRLPALPQGYGRGVIDGHAVIYKPGTQVIIDVAVLF